jgi:hypothetical protein
VITSAEASAIDAAHPGRTLVEGVKAATAADALGLLPPAVIADLLDAMYDRAALAAARGNAADYRAAIRAVIEGLAGPTRRARRSGGRSPSR